MGIKSNSSIMKNTKSTSNSSICNKRRGPTGCSRGRPPPGEVPRQPRPPDIQRSREMWYNTNNDDDNNNKEGAFAQGASHHCAGSWVFITGGCSGRGVQCMGVVSYNQLV